MLLAMLLANGHKTLRKRHDEDAFSDKKAHGVVD